MLAAGEKNLNTGWLTQQNMQLALFVDGNLIFLKNAGKYGGDVRVGCVHT